MSAIRFPRLHIAESIVNRILNADDEIKRGIKRDLVGEQLEQLAALAPQPGAEAAAPDPTLLGGEIDIQLREPIPPVQPDQAVLEGAATGESAPLEALLTDGGMQ